MALSRVAPGTFSVPSWSKLLLKIHLFPWRLLKEDSSDSGYVIDESDEFFRFLFWKDLSEDKKDNFIEDDD
jgi:hypothetical protein